MTKTQSLQTEIEAIETELAKLRHERSQLEQPSLAPVGGPEQIVTAAKAAAVALSQRQPQLDGIDQAIALLLSQIPPKQAEIEALQKQQEKDALRANIDEFEPQLLAVVHRINQMSLQMDAACAEYRQLALAYNQTRSELVNEQVFPAAMNVSGVPYVTTQVGRGFNLKLAMRNLGAAIAFEQVPPPYVPQNFSNEPTIETKILLQRDFLVKIQQFRDQTPLWEQSRIAVYEDQINECLRQIKKLESQEITA